MVEGQKFRLGFGVWGLGFVVWSVWELLIGFLITVCISQIIVQQNHKKIHFYLFFYTVHVVRSFTDYSTFFAAEQWQ